MFRRNRQIELFREIKIEAFLIQQERNIKNNIDRYSETYLSSLDIESEIAKLIKSCDLNVPVLEKEKTTTSISIEQISGRQFPSGTMFQPGKMYDIELANYNIPFIGNFDFFKCFPKSYSNRSVIAELNRNSIIIKLTNWGKISGNEKAIEDLKNELLRTIERVENSLEAIKKEVNTFIPILENKIREYIISLKKTIELKSDSSDKLNPFN